MIDINELRRLAQAATPGPWWVNQDGLNHGFDRGVLEINANDWHALAGAWGVTGAKPSEEGVANAAFIAAANPAAINELLDRLEAWENVFSHLGTPDEVGNEWHALSDRLEAAESALSNLGVTPEEAKEGLARHKATLARLEAAEKERDALRAQIERMERLSQMVVTTFSHDDPPTFRQGVPTHEIEDVVTADQCSWLVAEIRRLRAKIAEAEKQEPVAWLHETRRDSDVVTTAVKHVWGKTVVGAMAAFQFRSIPSPAHSPRRACRWT